jgi:lysophospholipase L1-like esterase
MRAPPLRLKLGLAGASVLLALVVLELVLRAALPLVPPLRGRTYAMRIADGRAVGLPSLPLLHDAQTSDPRLRLELPPAVAFELRYDAGEEHEHAYMQYEDGWFVLEVHTNAAGMRGPMPREPKTPGTRRVACLGDSFTFGDGVHFEDTWVAQLADGFHAAGGRRDLEVLDFGVPGYDSQDVAAELEVKVLPLEPDLVIYAMVLNDPPIRGDEELISLGKRAVADLAATIAPRTGLARLSHIAALIQSRERMSRLESSYQAFVKARFEANRASWKTFSSNLERMRELTSAAGVELVVYVFPMLDSLDGEYPFQEEHQIVTSACARLGIQAVDLLAAFDGAEAADLWVHATDQHPNPRGHALALARIVEHLVAHEDQLLP